MRDNANSHKGNYIGKWSASIKTGRKAILVVHGIVPTDETKHPFSLKIADLQGIHPSILVLELKPDVALIEGLGEVQIYYSEMIDNYDQYDSILVRGDGRALAFFDIQKVE